MSSSKDFNILKPTPFRACTLGSCHHQLKKMKYYLAWNGDMEPLETETECSSDASAKSVISSLFPNSFACALSHIEKSFEVTFVNGNTFVKAHAESSKPTYDEINLRKNETDTNIDRFRTAGEENRTVVTEVHDSFENLNIEQNGITIRDSFEETNIHRNSAATYDSFEYRNIKQNDIEMHDYLKDKIEQISIAEHYSFNDVNTEHYSTETHNPLTNISIELTTTPTRDYFKNSNTELIYAQVGHSSEEMSTERNRNAFLVSIHDSAAAEMPTEQNHPAFSMSAHDSVAAEMPTERNHTAFLTPAHDSVVAEVPTERNRSAFLTPARDSVAAEMPTERNHTPLLTPAHNSDAEEMYTERNSSTFLTPEHDSVAAEMATERNRTELLTPAHDSVAEKVHTERNHTAFLTPAHNSVSEEIHSERHRSAFMTPAHNSIAAEIPTEWNHTAFLSPAHDSVAAEMSTVRNRSAFLKPAHNSVAEEMHTERNHSAFLTPAHDSVAEKMHTEWNHAALLMPGHNSVSEEIHTERNRTAFLTPAHNSVAEVMHTERNRTAILTPAHDSVAAEMPTKRNSTDFFTPAHNSVTEEMRTESIGADFLKRAPDFSAEEMRTKRNFTDIFTPAHYFVAEDMQTEQNSTYPLTSMHDPVINFSNSEQNDNVDKRAFSCFILPATNYADKRNGILTYDCSKDMQNQFHAKEPTITSNITNSMQNISDIPIPRKRAKRQSYEESDLVCTYVNTRRNNYIAEAVRRDPFTSFKNLEHGSAMVKTPYHCYSSPPMHDSKAGNSGGNYSDTFGSMLDPHTNLKILEPGGTMAKPYYSPIYYPQPVKHHSIIQNSQQNSMHMLHDYAAYDSSRCMQNHHSAVDLDDAVFTLTSILPNSMQNMGGRKTSMSTNVTHFQKQDAPFGSFCKANTNCAAVEQLSTRSTESPNNEIVIDRKTMENSKDAGVTIEQQMPGLRTEHQVAKEYGSDYVDMNTEGNEFSAICDTVTNFMNFKQGDTSVKKAPSYCSSPASHCPIYENFTSNCDSSKDIQNQHCAVDQEEIARQNQHCAVDQEEIARQNQHCEVDQEEIARTLYFDLPNSMGNIRENGTSLTTNLTDPQNQDSSTIYYLEDENTNCSFELPEENTVGLNNEKYFISKTHKTPKAAVKQPMRRRAAKSQPMKKSATKQKQERRIKMEMKKIHDERSKFLRLVLKHAKQFKQYHAKMRAQKKREAKSVAKALQKRATKRKYEKKSIPTKPRCKRGARRKFQNPSF